MTLYIQISLILMYFYSHLLVMMFSNALMLSPGWCPKCFGIYTYHTYISRKQPLLSEINTFHKMTFNA